VTALMTVLVCGGRDYTDRARLFRLLDFNRAKIGMIVHGGAKGADTLAGNWCYERGVPMMLVPAEWARFGKKAGFIRNEKMLAIGRPDLVVAFPGGVGTAMMVQLAKQAGVRVIEVDARQRVGHTAACQSSSRCRIRPAGHFAGAAFAGRPCFHATLPAR
jgi:hypothetical protein